MKYNEFTPTSDSVSESYLSRWDSEVAIPLMEWQQMLSEAKLSPEQINALFGDVAERTKDMKTTTGKVAGVAAKGAKLAAKALPTNIAAKIHELVKDTKPVKNADEWFEKKKAELRTKLGGDDSKIANSLAWLGNFSKKHPIYSGAAIGVLTAAIAIAGGPAGAALAGGLLNTAKSLIQGDSLSKSLATGLGTAGVSALAGWGIKELSNMIGGIHVNVSQIPGYTDLTKVETNVDINGVSVLNIDTYMLPGTHAKYERLLQLADEAFDAHDYSKSAKIYQTLSNFFRSDDYIKNIEDVLLNNTKLKDAALASAKKAAEFWHRVSAGVQGAATGAASADQKSSTSESINLSEADIKGIASSIANWAKKQASQVTQQITPEKLGNAWRAAGSPQDSNAVHGILLKAGVPADVLAAAYGSQKIPVPRGQSMTKDAIRKREARAQGRTAAPSAKAAAPAKAATAAPSVKTGNAELDNKVNALLAKDGKDAAIKYLQDLKATAQASPGIKTGNAALDAKVNAIVAKDGKTAAFKYLQDLKAKVAIPQKPRVRVPAGRQVSQPTPAATAATTTDKRAAVPKVSAPKGKKPLISKADMDNPEYAKLISKVKAAGG